MNNYTIDNLGYDRSLSKGSILESNSEIFAEQFQSNFPNYFTDAVSPAVIQSGELNGNLNVVKGYIQSSKFQTGVNGWKFDAVGNLEANTGTFRGSLYAASGTIGGWVIDDEGLYYSGSGDANIRTSETVGSGSNGVLLDEDGIKVYDDVLGVVVNLPSDGSAPSFSSGVIQKTTFEINTNAVLRTSETVGDGTASSAGVIINNSGFYACEANQNVLDANIKLTSQGGGYFKGTINASEINSSQINGADINGSIITGGLLRTAESGQRTEITNIGIQLMNGSVGSTFSDETRLYGDSDYKYGNGVLAYFNNQDKVVPLYINAEQTVADIHLYNRSAEPTGKAEIGDLAVIGGILSICTTAGTPGDWESVSALSTEIPSISPSLSPSISPSISPSVSPS